MFVRILTLVIVIGFFTSASLPLFANLVETNPTSKCFDKFGIKKGYQDSPIGKNCN